MGTRRRNSRLAGACVVGWLSLAAPAVSFAQASYPVRFQSAAEEVQERQQRVAEWNRQAILGGILLSITVGFGVSITAIQIMSNQKGKIPKIATGIMGAMVSAVAVVNTQALDGDFKTLRYRAIEGKILVKSANDLLAIRDSLRTDSDRDAILAEVGKKVGAFDQLDKGGAAAPVRAQLGESDGLFAIVHAEQASCGCLGASERQVGFQYFCGTGADRSIGAAKEQARAQAINTAVAGLRNKGDAAARSPASLADYVQRVSTEADSCVKPMGGVFQVSVLLRIADTLTSPRAQTAFVNRVQIAAAVADPFAGRWRLDAPRSSMGIYGEIRDEVRDIRRSGSTVLIQWRRVLRNGQTEQGTYDLPCDGAEHAAGGQVRACRAAASDTIDSYVKTPGHQPPILYSVEKVAGDMLTITTYRDPAHQQPIATLVFDRVPQ